MTLTPRSPTSIAISQLSGGGAEKVTLELARMMKADGRLSRIYTGLQQPGEAPGLPVVDLHAPRALRAMTRFVRAVGDDPAQSFLLTLGYINLAPAIRLRRPGTRIVSRVGNSMGPELLTLSASARMRYLGSMRLSLRAADAVIAQSDYMGRDLERNFPFVSGKLHVIPNFIEHELRSWTPSTLPPMAEPYLLCAATQKPQKALDLLLEAFARSPARKDCRLVVAGVAPNDALFGRWMDSNGLKPEEVVRPGFVDPYPWIAHARACVLPSRFEGFSNFLLEAAALGKPIVATDCPGGNADLFAHYRNATIVPMNDADALADAMAGPGRDIDRQSATAALAPFHEDRVYAQYLAVIDGRAG